MLAQIVSLIMDNMEAAVSKNELRHGVKGKNQAFSGGPSMFPGAVLALPTATWCQTTANATPALPCFQDALTNSLASDTPGHPQASNTGSIKHQIISLTASI